ncbi:hypothetical protein SAMD00079811_19230 [Scytonema sp. HK-05]|nr:hypothetical protein SAMD00079811_19230 [Scytonema sp. HK-05]
MQAAASTPLSPPIRSSCWTWVGARGDYRDKFEVILSMMNCIAKDCGNYPALASPEGGVVHSLSIRAPKIPLVVTRFLPEEDLFKKRRRREKTRRKKRRKLGNLVAGRESELKIS